MEEKTKMFFFQIFFDASFLRFGWLSSSQLRLRLLIKKKIGIMWIYNKPSSDSSSSLLLSLISILSGAPFFCSFHLCSWITVPSLCLFFPLCDSSCPSRGLAAFRRFTDSSKGSVSNAHLTLLPFCYGHTHTRTSDLWAHSLFSPRRLQTSFEAADKVPAHFFESLEENIWHISLDETSENKPAESLSLWKCYRSAPRPRSQLRVRHPAWQ